MTAAQLRVQKGGLSSQFIPFERIIIRSDTPNVSRDAFQSFRQQYIYDVHRSYVLDLTELELPDTMKTTFPNPADVLNFELTITPDEGELSLSVSGPASVFPRPSSSRRPSRSPD